MTVYNPEKREEHYQSLQDHLDGEAMRKLCLVADKFGVTAGIFLKRIIPEFYLKFVGIEGKDLKYAIKPKKKIKGK